jgi:hypothetical protein
MPKNPERLDHELIIKRHLTAEKKLIKKLKERKEVYKEILIQIDNYIDYAYDQAKNNDNGELRLKYLETIEEEESLRGKICEYLKKNDKLIESVNKSNFDYKL